MKFIVLFSIIGLMGCSSLITRTDLKNCQSQCTTKAETMKKVSKKDGKVICECKKLSCVE